MSNNNVLPVILCGGSGSRLWPLSRKSFPKQYLSFNSGNNETLLQETHNRLLHVKNICDPILICNEEHRFIVAEQMNQINVKPSSILLEPIGKNTAPAITVAALNALEKNVDPILLVLSSDHKIDNVDNFRKVIEIGKKYALEGRIVTFGVLPTSPETGYGYIKADSPFDESLIIGKDIDKFLEKPDREKAQELIKDKRYTWNSGIFMFKARIILEEIKKFEPELFKYCDESLKKNLCDLDFQRIDKDAFEKCPNLSIDVAVMEKTSLGTVLPLDAGWSDIGSWNAVWENSKKDKNNNFKKGEILEKNSLNCYLRGESRLLVGIGLKDLIVVETSDAILIANKNYSQEVKSVVEELKNKGISEGLEHRKVFRPWGFYISVVEDLNWKVKLIYVNPGCELSLQRHKFRAEHWVVVSGTAKVQIDKNEMMLNQNESTFIPLGKLHRLSNPKDEPLSIIEIQSGNYLGEDDIERFEDNYGRVQNKKKF